MIDTTATKEAHAAIAEIGERLMMIRIGLEQAHEQARVGCRALGNAQTAARLANDMPRPLLDTQQRALDAMRALSSAFDDALARHEEISLIAVGTATALEKLPTRE